MLDVLIQPDLAYDYTQITDSDTRTLARRAAQDIKPRLRRAAQDIVVIGQRLAEVQAKLEHGQWTPWLETEFDMTYRTAVNFIRVAERFSGKSEMISDLTPTALYALAAPSTPDDAIVEVEQRIEAGKPPTVAETKQIIANHKPPSPTLPPADKLVVDWTDEDWDAYTANKAAQIPPAPFSPSPGTGEAGRVSPSTDNRDLSVEAEPAPPAEPSRLAVHFSSEDDQHYTPDPVWQAALRVMGSIDLDPCSNSHSTPNVPATTHYTAEDDGLRQFWEGNVFLNPPYGRQIGDWIAKLVEAHRSGDVPQAIALLPARTDTQWWQLIRDYPVCFVTGRLKFKGNDDNAAPFPSAIVFLSHYESDIPAFRRVFSTFGDIWRRIK